MSENSMYQPLGWQRGEEKACLAALASWMHLDAYPVEVFVQKIWDDPDFDSELCLVMKTGDSLTGFAMGVLREHADGDKRGYIKMLALAPERRGQGLGFTLVKALETKLFARGATCIRLGESAPNYLAPGLDPRYTHAWTLFESLGYRIIGHTFNLSVSLPVLQNAPLKKLPGDLVLKRGEPADADALRVFLKAHWPSWCAEVLPALQANPASIFLAFAGGELVAFAAYECNNRGAGWFGPMGTAPQARGSGLGRRLLLLVLEAMQREGFAKAIIPWVGPVRFYQKAVGATIDRVFFRMQKDRPTG